MPAGAGREDCQRQPAGQDERERTSQKPKRGKVEHPRDSAEPKGETNVWPREGNRSGAEQIGNWKLEIGNWKLESLIQECTHE